MIVSPGVYKSRVVSHYWTTSTPGTPGLSIVVAILDDMFDEQKMTGTIWFSDKAMGMARAQLKLFGISPETHNIDDIGNTISLEGMEVEVTVVEEEYKGQRSLRINRFGGRPAPPTRETLQTIQQKLKAAQKKPAGENPYSEPIEAPPSVPEPPVAGPGLTPAEIAAESEGEDDIPF